MDDIIGNINIKLKKRIMRGVYIVWFFRSVYCKMFGFAALVLSASFYISFLSVFRNSISSSYSPGAVLNYMFFSFMAADVVSKTLVVFMAAAILTLGRDVVKNRKADARIQLARI